MLPQLELSSILSTLMLGRKRGVRTIHYSTGKQTHADFHHEGNQSRDDFHNARYPEDCFPSAEYRFHHLRRAKVAGYSFETNRDKVPHTWKWRITWLRFQKSGQVTTPANTWDASEVVNGTGGVLTIQVMVSGKTATISCKLKGTNPSSGSVTQYLKTQANSIGFDKILQHESGMTNFNFLGEPKRSFDNGYGIAQLTKPAPNYEQCWDWKKNVDAGLSLFAAKQRAAEVYLTQNGRTFTADQLAHETVSRWNGGAYHVWDSKAGAWVRNPDIICDPGTGNIGWNMQNPGNAGKTEEQLHKRDSGQFRKGRIANADWVYSGVCYADKILD